MAFRSDATVEAAQARRSRVPLRASDLHMISTTPIRRLGTNRAQNDSDATFEVGR